MDRAHRVDQLQYLVGVRDRLELLQGRGGAVHVQHLQLGLRARVPDRDPRHETVPLRLRQGVGALHLDRVLGGDDHEGRGQLVGLPVHRDLALLHRLQQRGLGLGRGAVDLVTDHDLGEDRAGLELEVPPLLVVDAHAGDVRRQQVGGELDTPHRAVDGPGQRLGEHRLAHARHVLDEQMALREQHGQREPHDLGLALDHGLHRPADPLRRGGQIPPRARLRPRGVTSKARLLVIGRHPALLGPCPALRGARDTPLRAHVLRTDRPSPPCAAPAARPRRRHSRILAARAASRHGLWITHPTGRAAAVPAA